MPENFAVFEREIISRHNLYPPRRERPEVRVSKVVNADHRAYKLLEITPFGVAWNWDAKIAETQKNLARYADNHLAPAVIAADKLRLAVEWIDGVTADRLPRKPETFQQLARCLSSGMLPLEEADATRALAAIRNDAAYLRRLSVLDEATEAKLERLLAGEAGFVIPRAWRLVTGFADPGLNNFVRDQQGRMRYIDVFSVKNQPAGLILVAQLGRIPFRFRSVFWGECCRQGISEQESEIPFYSLWHFIRVLRQWAFYLPTDIPKRAKAVKKIRKNHRLLISFLAAAFRGPERAGRWCRRHRW